MIKSFKLSTVLIIILLLIIALIVYFGYYFRMGSSPLQELALQLSKPKFVTAVEGGQSPLARPLAVVSGPGGRIYVADTGNNRIVVFDANGKPVMYFGKKGTGQGEFNFPSGIAVSKSGKVFVADFKNNRVQVFDADGHLQKVIDSDRVLDERAKPVKFSPVTLAVDSQERLYISDVFRQRILVLDRDDRLDRVIGQEGSMPGQLLYANGITVDEDNKQLLVSDSNNARIQAFTLDGKFLWKQEAAGKDSNLVLPKGITVAGKVIYVVDNPAHRICAYDKDGKFLYSFGSRSADVDGFNFPSGIAWAQDLGYLLITDRENNRISIYK